MYGVLVSKLMSNFKSKENALLGQGCVLQSLVSNAEPVHLVPPCWGTGFVQVLVLFCVPVPQGFVHSDGGEPMTTFGDLGNYVKGFTCSPHEI